MTKERLYLYDTTLRDGQQTHGVDFSAEDKIRIANALDDLGIDYVEGGWPGANPTDNDFFAAAPKLSTAVFAAFGMTKRAGRSAANDDVLAAVINANTPAVCLVGKSHDFHVTTALGITLEENLENIKGSFEHLKTLGRESLYDAEHFFDGFKANPEYALKCCKAAFDAGARWIVLCDTNGGALPEDVARAVKAVIASGMPGDHVGIHTHNDGGLGEDLIQSLAVKVVPVLVRDENKVGVGKFAVVSQSAERVHVDNLVGEGHHQGPMPDKGYEQVPTCGGYGVGRKMVVSGESSG